MIGNILSKISTQSFKVKSPVDIVGDVYIKLKNDYTTFVMEVEWPGIFFLDEVEIQSNIIEPVNRFAKELPAGTNVSFQYFSRPGFPDFEDSPKDTYIDKSLNNVFRGKETTFVKSLITVSFPRNYSPAYFVTASDESIIRTQARKGGSKIEKEDLSLYTPFLTGFINDLKGICRVKLYSTRDSLLRYCNDYLNLRFFDPENKITALEDNDTYVNAGSKVFSFVSLAKNPDAEIIPVSYPSHTRDEKKVSSGFMELPASFVHSLGLGLNVPHVTTLNFTVHHTDKFAKTLNEKVIKTAGGIARPFDGNETKAALVRMLIDEVKSSVHERFVTYSLNVMAIGDSKKELDESESRIKDAFQKLDFSPVKESFLNMEIFIANMAGNGFEHPRIHLGMLRQMAYLFPFETPGTFSTSGIPVATKADTLAYLDLFNPQASFGNKNVYRTGMNMLLTGRTGAGKSNFMAMCFKHIVDHLNGRLIVLDKGNSFNRTISLLGGVKYEYTHEKPLSFNPFLLQRDEKGLVNYSLESLEILSPLILACIEESFDEKELSLIRDILNDQILKRYYDAYNDGEFKVLNFDSFYAFVTDFEDEVYKLSDENKTYRRIKNLFPFAKFLTVTEKFRSGNTHGELLNADHNFDLINNKVTLFELDKIQKDEFLFRIVTICISLLSNDLFKNERLEGEFKYVFIDEATFIFKNFMADNIAGLIQTARKHNGGVCIADQTYDSLEKSGVINRIIGNTDTVVWLKQRDVKSNWDIIKRVFGYTDREIRRIKSIEVQKEFREGVVQIGDDDFFSFRTYQSKEMYQAYNTDNKGMQSRINKKLDEYLEVLNNERAAFRQLKEDIDDGVI